MKNLKQAKYWQCPHCVAILLKPKEHTSTSLSVCQLCNKKTSDLEIIGGQYDKVTKSIDVKKWNQSKRLARGQDIKNARMAYLALAGFLLISLIFYLQFMQAVDSISCANPEYDKTRIGMTSQEVIDLLGQPQQKTPSPDGEIWSYQIPNWKGDIQLRFNQKQILARRNCQ